MSRVTRSALLLAALALAAAARADDASAGADATPVAIEAGKSLNLCRAGLSACPVTQFICDDPKVAKIENGPDGPELKGISPGTTLCSVLGPGRAFRRVLRVTVRAAAAPGRG